MFLHYFNSPAICFGLLQISGSFSFLFFKNCLSFWLFGTVLVSIFLFTLFSIVKYIAGLLWLIEYYMLEYFLPLTQWVCWLPLKSLDSTMGLILVNQQVSLLFSFAIQIPLNACAILFYRQKHIKLHFPFFQAGVMQASNQLQQLSLYYTKQKPSHLILI